MWYVHTIDSSILKRNEVLIIAITWMKWKDAKLQKIRHKRILYLFIYIEVPLNCRIHRESRMVASRGLVRSRELLFYQTQSFSGMRKESSRWTVMTAAQQRVCVVNTTELYNWKRWNQKRMKLTDRVPSLQERTKLTDRVEYLACRKGWS